MINYNEENLAKAKQAKSVEELLTLAKESGVEMTAEQAQDILARLNQKSGELADDELDNVAGGGCYAGDGRLVVTLGHYCDHYGCSDCGGEGTAVTSHNTIVCANCRSIWVGCNHCRYVSYESSHWLCNHPINRQG
jgi:hypothetical protein